ncbi:hypothetical protein HYH02_007319 [Chlamydomonas schloesseri]|uniref:Uncharacterized protein n=1 Tax=Chlamydomonas schloesseri TaxID=2026947 RepID=A0A836B5B5_9CHLO|nr:hypothetical protein HYH02_007319 [Chlamydomonas schloesseri]|eukprot:KAG2447863.1 hypothetical protein HYH02_007319 [Chlamydomonas schloesseri]
MAVAQAKQQPGAAAGDPAGAAATGMGDSSLSAASQRQPARCGEGSEGGLLSRLQPSGVAAALGRGLSPVASAGGGLGGGGTVGSVAISDAAALLLASTASTCGANLHGPAGVSDWPAGPAAAAATTLLARAVTTRKPTVHLFSPQQPQPEGGARAAAAAVEAAAAAAAAAPALNRSNSSSNSNREEVDVLLQQLPADCAHDLAALMEAAAESPSSGGPQQQQQQQQLIFVALPLTSGKRLLGALWLVFQGAAPPAAAPAAGGGALLQPQQGGAAQQQQPARGYSHTNPGLMLEAAAEPPPMTPPPPSPDVMQALARSPAALQQLALTAAMALAPTPLEADYLRWLAAALAELAAAPTLRALVAGVCATLAQHVRRRCLVEPAAVQSALVPGSGATAAFWLSPDARAAPSRVAAAVQQAVALPPVPMASRMASFTAGSGLPLAPVGPSLTPAAAGWGRGGGGGGGSSTRGTGTALEASGSVATEAAMPTGCVGFVDDPADPVAGNSSAGSRRWQHRAVAGAAVVGHRPLRRTASIATIVHSPCGFDGASLAVAGSGAGNSTRSVQGKVATAGPAVMTRAAESMLQPPVGGGLDSCATAGDCESPSHSNAALHSALSNLLVLSQHEHQQRQLHLQMAGAAAGYGGGGGSGGGNASLTSVALPVLSAKAFPLSHTLLQLVVAGHAGSAGKDVHEGSSSPVSGLLVADTASHLADVRQPTRDVCMMQRVVRRGAWRAAAAAAAASTTATPAPPAARYAVGPAAAAAAGLIQPGAMHGGGSSSNNSGDAFSMALFGMELAEGGSSLGLYLAFPSLLPEPLLVSTYGSCVALLEQVVDLIRFKLQMPDLGPEFSMLCAGVPGSYVTLAQQPPPPPVPLPSLPRQHTQLGEVPSPTSFASAGASGWGAGFSRVAADRRKSQSDRGMAAGGGFYTAAAASAMLAASVSVSAAATGAAEPASFSGPVNICIADSSQRGLKLPQGSQLLGVGAGAGAAAAQPATPGPPVEAMAPPREAAAAATAAPFYPPVHSSSQDRKGTQQPAQSLLQEEQPPLPRSAFMQLLLSTSDSTTAPAAASLAAASQSSHCTHDPVLLAAAFASTTRPLMTATTYSSHHEAGSLMNTGNTTATTKSAASSKLVASSSRAGAAVPPAAVGFGHFASQQADEVEAAVGPAGQSVGPPALMTVRDLDETWSMRSMMDTVVEGIMTNIKRSAGAAAAEERHDDDDSAGTLDPLDPRRSRSRCVTQCTRRPA